MVVECMRGMCSED